MVNFSTYWRTILDASLIPLTVLTVLEFIWYALETVVNPEIISIILYLVKFVILIFAGFCAEKKYKMDIIGSAATGAVTYGILSIIEWLIISPIFYGGIFYYSGPFDIIISIVKALVLGGILGGVGFFVATSEYSKMIEDKIPCIEVNIFRRFKRISKTD